MRGIGVSEENQAGPAIDTQWFQERLADQRLTQRSAAKHMNMDPASLSLLFSGKRRLRVDQAADLAELLKVPLNEVIRRAGVELTGSKRGILNVIGFIDGKGAVTVREDAPGMAFRFDIEVPATAKGFQFRTAQSEADVWDGFIVAVDAPTVAAAAIGNTGVIKTRDHGSLFGKARRGYATDEYTIIGLNGDVMHDVRIESFMPLIAMRPV